MEGLAGLGPGQSRLLSAMAPALGAEEADVT